MIERMGAYQRATGLKPIGVHRPAADKLAARLAQLSLQIVSDECSPLAVNRLAFTLVTTSGAVIPDGRSGVSWQARGGGESPGSVRVEVE